MKFPNRKHKTTKEDRSKAPGPRQRKAKDLTAPKLPLTPVDGYAGYGKLAERGDVQLAFCWSHMRRNFYERAAPGPAPIASEALKQIAEFYAIEKDIRGRSAEERFVVRQQKSRPLAEIFERRLRAKLALISRDHENVSPFLGYKLRDGGNITSSAENTQFQFCLKT